MLVRPGMPEEFYNPGMQQKVQRSQIIGTVTLLTGVVINSILIFADYCISVDFYILLVFVFTTGFVSMIVPLAMGVRVPSPIEYAGSIIQRFIFKMTS